MNNRCKTDFMNFLKISKTSLAALGRIYGKVQQPLKNGKLFKRVFKGRPEVEPQVLLGQQTVREFEAKRRAFIV